MGLYWPNTNITSVGGNIEVDGFLRSDDVTVPAFHVQNDINAAITTANGRPITWGQTIFDFGSNMSSTTFVAPLDGLYWFYVWMMDENDGPNVDDYYDIQVNGFIGFSRGARGYSSGNSAHHHQWPCGGIFRLLTNDTVRVYVGRIDNGFYGFDHKYTQFQGCYLGDY